MQFDDKKLKDVLLQGSYISEEDVKLAEKALPTYGGSLVDYLLAEGVVTKDIVGQAFAELFKTPYAGLSSRPVGAEQVLKIPEDIGRRFRVVYITEDKTTATLATDDPTKKGLLLSLKKIVPQKKIVLAYALPDDIEAAFVYYRKKLATRFSSIIKQNKRIAPEIIDEIFSDAILYRASDVHFEPQEDEVLIRFRIDGVLEEAGRIPKEHYENILNRLKVQAQLRIDEHLAAQDGALSFESDGMVTDLRLSIMPTLEGEKVVIRLLLHYVQSLALTDLGLTREHERLLLEASRKPFGMILVTGPTGSGKTTTLYALLKICNTPGVNITTIEDPVEYRLKGINQIQVNTQTNLTFAKGLRSIVRQDPDIILVGEIRDQETADISVNAALTGHILLSTFHANDAATAVPRLLEMGVEPFLLASTLQAVLAQRLVRKICPGCRYGETFSAADVKKKYPKAVDFFTTKEITLYRGKGCSACNHSGYKGRLGIYEFIMGTPELQNLILNHPSAQQIWEVARSQGSTSLFEDGLEKVWSGITTIDELLRVAAPPRKKITT